MTKRLDDESGDCGQEAASERDQRYDIEVLRDRLVVGVLRLSPGRQGRSYQERCVTRGRAESVPHAHSPVDVGIRREPAEFTRSYVACSMDPGSRGYEGTYCAAVIEEDLHRPAGVHMDDSGEGNGRRREHVDDLDSLVTHPDAGKPVGNNSEGAGKRCEPDRWDGLPSTGRDDVGHRHCDSDHHDRDSRPAGGARAIRFGRGHSTMLSQAGGVSG